MFELCSEGNQEKLSHVTHVEAQVGREVHLLLIHDLGTRCGGAVSVTSWPRFASGEGTPVHIGEEAG
jgi:hypothetical protein